MEFVCNERREVSSDEKKKDLLFTDDYLRLDSCYLFIHTNVVAGLLLMIDFECCFL